MSKLLIKIGFVDYTFFFLAFLLSEIYSIELLQKFSSITIQCTEKRLAFDSSEFKLNEKIFFSFTLDDNGLDKILYFDYFQDIDLSDPIEILGFELFKKSESTSSFSKKKNNKVTSMTHYFTVKKEIEEDFLIMQLPCTYGTLTVENTKEDKEKRNIIIISVVCSVCFVIVIVIIIFTCIRRNRMRMARQAMKIGAMGQMASPGYYPQHGRMSGLGSNYLMNNLPPAQGSLIPQAIPYSKGAQDMTQLADPPNSIDPSISRKRKKKHK